MERKLESVKFKLTTFELGTDFIDGNNPEQWLVEQAQTYKKLKLGWLLAHADDGVIWGQITASKTNDPFKATLSCTPFPDTSPPLRPDTLQQLRLFGEAGELHVWRTGPGRFQARLLDETEAAEEKRYFDEAQILWGDRSEEQKAGYTLVVEGQGVRHAVPPVEPTAQFGSEKKRRRPLRLTLRHYLTHDDIGQARIYLSRLVNLSTV